MKTLLDFNSKRGFLGFAEKLLNEMLKKDVIACNAMIIALSSHNRMEDARKLFEEIPVKCLASWNSMIMCYCKQGNVDLSREIFLLKYSRGCCVMECFDQSIL